MDPGSLFDDLVELDRGRCDGLADVEGIAKGRGQEVDRPALAVGTLGDAENARRMGRVVLERAERAAGQDRTNGYALSAGVAALAALEEWDRARDWMRRGLLIDPDNLLMRYSFACTLARSRSEPEAALGLLRPLLEQDTGRLVAAAPTDPDLAGLRYDPRFQAMLAAAAARLAEAKSADAAGVRESAP